MFKKILFAYDGSEGSHRAEEFVTELAKKFGGSVIVLFAFHPIPRSWGEPFAEQAIQKETTQGRALVQSAVQRFQAAGIRAESEVLEGQAAEVITRSAAFHECDAIVIGSRGLGQTTAHLLGSVSDRVLHTAKCAVLTVR